MIKPEIVYLYQAVRTGDRKQMVTSLNPMVRETKDCVMEFDKGILKVSQESWPEDLYIGLANIRSMNVKKENLDDGKETTATKKTTKKTTKSGSKD